MKTSQELKRDCLVKQQSRYARRGREGWSRMLDELCEDYGYERKHAIKLLGEGTLPLLSQLRTASRLNVPSNLRRSGTESSSWI